MDRWKPSSISDKLKEPASNPEEAELRYQAKQEIELETEKTLKVMHVIEMLEDLDDVQNVFSNLSMSEEALSELEAE